MATGARPHGGTRSPLLGRWSQSVAMRVQGMWWHMSSPLEELEPDYDHRRRVTWQHGSSSLREAEPKSHHEHGATSRHGSAPLMEAEPKGPSWVRRHVATWEPTSRGGTILEAACKCLTRFLLMLILIWRVQGGQGTNTNYNPLTKGKKKIYYISHQQGLDGRYNRNFCNTYCYNAWTIYTILFWLAFS
jgi:hypothetical protein